MSDAVFQAATIPQPGFSDPSSDSQAVFRAILNAFSYPGRKFSITGPQDVPAALGSALAAVELTLFDIDTAVWHHPVLAQDESAMGYLLFHTGLKRCTELADADFVVATVDSMPALNELRTGSDLSPQESTTLVLDAREMTGAHNWALRNQGCSEGLKPPASSRLLAV